MGCYRPPYYITAYALAQKRGFKGTLDEWLESLKGSEVELRYENDILQWRHEGEEQWQDLLDLSAIADSKTACTEAAEQAAQDRALTEAFAKQLACHVPLRFEIGSIDGASGDNAETSIFIRSGFFPIASSALDVFAPDEFQTALFFYNSSMEICGITNYTAGSYREVMEDDGRKFARLVVHPAGQVVEDVDAIAAQVAVFSPPKVEGMPTLVIPVEPDAGAVSDEYFDEMLAAAQRGQSVRLWFKSNDTYYDLQSLHNGPPPWMVFARVDMGFKITILTVERGLLTIYGSVFCVPHTRTINGKALSLDITLTAEDVGALPDSTQIPEVPEALPNPNKLIISGAVSAEYDGSAPVSVSIPHSSVDPEAVDSAVTEYLRSNPVKTAYEYAVDGGYPGTEAEFARELRYLEQKNDNQNRELSQLWAMVSELYQQTKTYPTLMAGQSGVSIAPWFSLSNRAEGVEGSKYWTDVEFRDSLGDLDVSDTENVKSWSIGATADDAVTAYADHNTRTIYIVGNGSGKIRLNPMSNMFFAAFNNLERIRGLELLDATYAENLAGFFAECYALTEIDLSSWEVPNVHTINGMFNKCTSLKKVIMPQHGWPGIISVNNTGFVFQGCTSVTTIDLGRGLRYIGNQCFLGCAALRELRGTEDVVQVGTEAFMCCFELEDIGFLKSLTTVGDFGFTGTPKLQYSGVRRDNITSLGASAFRASSVEDSVCLDNLPADIVGSLATRQARWGDNLSVVQDGAKLFPEVEMVIKNPDSQTNYAGITFAGSTIAAAGCGPLSLFHCWQILHPDAKEADIEFETWYEDKLGEERMAEYDYANGSYGGEMTYTIVHDIAKSDNPSLGLVMSEKFTPLEVDRIKMALEAGNPLVCIIKTFSANSSGNHMVTIYGFNKSTGKLRVVDSGWPEKAYQVELSLEDLMHYVDEDYFSKVYVVSLAETDSTGG